MTTERNKQKSQSHFCLYLIPKDVRVRIDLAKQRAPDRKAIIRRISERAARG
jgi:hypothetical protein